MKEAQFGVTGYLQYDTEVYQLVTIGSRGEYVLENIRTGAKYVPTVALFKVNAEVGEDDILPLDTPEIQVVEICDATLHPAE